MRITLICLRSALCFLSFGILVILSHLCLLLRLELLSDTVQSDKLWNKLMRSSSKYPSFFVVWMLGDRRGVVDLLYEVFTYVGCYVDG